MKSFLLLMILLISSAFAQNTTYYQALIVCEGKLDRNDHSNHIIRVFTKDDTCNIKKGSTVKAFMTKEDLDSIGSADFFPTMIEGSKKYISKTKWFYKFTSSYEGSKDSVHSFSVNKGDFYASREIEGKTVNYNDDGTVWFKDKFKLTCHPPEWHHGECGE